MEDLLAVGGLGDVGAPAGRQGHVGQFVDLARAQLGVEVDLQRPVEDRQVVLAPRPLPRLGQVLVVDQHQRVAAVSTKKMSFLHSFFLGQRTHHRKGNALQSRLASPMAPSLETLLESRLGRYLRSTLRASLDIPLKSRLGSYQFKVYFPDYFQVSLKVDSENLLHVPVVGTLYS